MFQIKQFQNIINRENIAKLSKFIDIEAADRKWSAAQYLGNADGVAKISFLLNCFYQTPLPDYFLKETGYSPWIAINFLTIRKQVHTDGTTLTNWHIDDNFFGGKIQAMTAWIATEDCGEIRPGLDFAVIDTKEKWNAFVALLTTKKVAQRRFLDFELEAHLGKFEVVTPRIKSGDAMVFGKNVVHRSQVMSGEFLPRASIEFRMAARETFEPTDPRPICLARIRTENHRKILEQTHIGSAKIDQIDLGLIPVWNPN